MISRTAGSRLLNGSSPSMPNNPLNESAPPLDLLIEAAHVAKVYIGDGRDLRIARPAIRQ